MRTTSFYSTMQVADLYRTDRWRIARLFEDSTLQEPPRLAGKRVISAAMLPAIEAELRRRKWINLCTDGLDAAVREAIDGAVEDGLPGLLKKSLTAEGEAR